MPVAAEVTPLEGDQVRIDVTVPEDEVRKQFDRTVKETSARTMSTARLRDSTSQQRDHYQAQVSGSADERAERSRRSTR